MQFLVAVHQSRATVSANNEVARAGEKDEKRFRKVLKISSPQLKKKFYPTVRRAADFVNRAPPNSHLIVHYSGHALVRRDAVGKPHLYLDNQSLEPLLRSLWRRPDITCGWLLDGCRTHEDPSVQGDELAALKRTAPPNLRWILAGHSGATTDVDRVPTTSPDGANTGFSFHSILTEQTASWLETAGTAPDLHTVLERGVDSGAINGTLY